MSLLGGNDEKPTFPGGALSSKAEAVLSKNCKLVGKLTSSGPIVIDCDLEGEVEAQERLTIGEDAVVKAKVKGIEVIVKGTVQGDVAAQSLVIEKKGKVIGNVSCTKIRIEEGALFEGSCIMPQADKVHTLSGKLGNEKGQEKAAVGN